MLLAIDIGNSNCHFALYREATDVSYFNFETEKSVNENFFLSRLDEQLKIAGIFSSAIKAVIVSSVVPDVSRVTSIVVEKLFATQPLFVEASLDCGMRFFYDDLKSLGPDRVCCSVAASAKYGGPVIAIDAGTAITFDCINNKGEFIGGAIMPGFKTAAQGLSARTARLPVIDLNVPETCCATNTVQAVQSGIIYGLIDAIDGMTNRMKNLLGTETKTVLTGGSADLISRHSKTPFIRNPHLIFEGLIIIAKRYKLIQS